MNPADARTVTQLVPVAEVAVDVDAPGISAPFSYAIPPSLAPDLAPGRCVHVPFAGRELVGVVVGLRELDCSDPLARRLKPVAAILQDAIALNADLLELTAWISQEYVCTRIQAIRCAAPTALTGQVEVRLSLVGGLTKEDLRALPIPQAHLVATLQAAGGSASRDELRHAANLEGFSSALAGLLKKGLALESRSTLRPSAHARMQRVCSLAQGATWTDRKPRSPQQQRLLQELALAARRGESAVPAPDLLRSAEAGQAALKALAGRGLVVISQARVLRAPYAQPTRPTEPPPLTAGQQRALEKLRHLLSSRTASTALLHGVTASGKTEVYLAAIQHTLAMGRTALVLLPEIALTAQVVEVFLGRFGGRLAVLHSRLSDGERYDEWQRINSGQARIVVGARSAVFAPLRDIGLIVVDEEHEASYKQESTPRYDARAVAAMRARQCGATLLLGSATPSLETFLASEPSSGLPGEPVARLEMPERIDSRPLPAVRVVDMRLEFQQRPVLFAQTLVEAIGERLRRGEQTILFLNRRGYARFVLCRECGWTARCPHCAVAMAFHSYDFSLRCHHCDYLCRAPRECPQCGGSKVKAFGIGTERVEEAVASHFPEARVVRMDRDTTTRKGAHGAILGAFRRHEADILIGTQMVAKGLDFPMVTLVGAISADTSLNMPDFRAAERTFQLLTQVAGRAGRGERPGEVVVQTFTPEHYAIQAAIRHDYRAFFDQEIEFRRELAYPPFSRLANLICSSELEAVAKTASERLAAAIRFAAPLPMEVIGPSTAPLSRLKGLYRYHVAIRGPVGSPLPEVVRAALNRLGPQERTGITVDIDPVRMV